MALTGQKALPTAILEVLGIFSLDKRTGNIKINIKQGVVRGYHVEEIHSVAR